MTVYAALPKRGLLWTAAVVSTRWPPALLRLGSHGETGGQLSVDGGADGVIVAYRRSRVTKSGDYEVVLMATADLY